MHYNNYIKSLEKTDYLYLMRSHVKNIELKIPFIKNRRIIFDKYNILIGPYGAGKSFLINLIYDGYIMGKSEVETLTGNPDYAKVSVKVTYNTISEWNYTYPRQNGEIYDRLFEEHLSICFLFDEPDILNDDTEVNGFLSYLKKIDGQIILTADIKNNINYPSEFKKIKI